MRAKVADVYARVVGTMQGSPTPLTAFVLVLIPQAELGTREEKREARETYLAAEFLMELRQAETAKGLFVDIDVLSKGV